MRNGSRKWVRLPRVMRRTSVSRFAPDVDSFELGLDRHGVAVREAAPLAQCGNAPTILRGGEPTQTDQAKDPEPIQESCAALNV